MPTDKMLSRKDGPIGSMIFNNPERHNATSLEMWEAADEILQDFANDKSIRVVVISGAGGKAFVSGADISKFESERATEAAVKHYNKTSDRMSTTLASMQKPTIAMIQGWCIGGGVSVATTCDLRVCSEDSKFGVPAAKLGLGYGIKGIRRLADLVGPSMRNSASTPHSGSRRLSAPSRAARARVWNPSIQVCDVAMMSITADRLLCSILRTADIARAMNS